jgi:hypothetical protein
MVLSLWPREAWVARHGIEWTAYYRANAILLPAPDSPATMEGRTVTVARLIFRTSGPARIAGRDRVFGRA